MRTSDKISSILKDAVNSIYQKQIEKQQKREKEKRQHQLAVDLQKKEAEKQHLQDLKRLFVASRLTFHLITQGDARDVFPNRQYKVSHVMDGAVLDVRVKVFPPDSGAQPKICKKLLKELAVGEKNFWESFLQNSQVIAEEMRCLEQDAAQICCEMNEMYQKGTLTESKRIQMQKNYDEYYADYCELKKELQMRREIMQSGFYISELQFSDGFLEIAVDM